MVNLFRRIFMVDTHKLGINFRNYKTKLITSIVLNKYLVNYFGDNFIGGRWALSLDEAILWCPNVFLFFFNFKSFS